MGSNPGTPRGIAVRPRSFAHARDRVGRRSFGLGSAARHASGAGVPGRGRRAFSTLSMPRGQAGSERCRQGSERPIIIECPYIPHAHYYCCDADGSERLGCAPSVIAPIMGLVCVTPQATTGRRSCRSPTCAPTSAQAPSLRSQAAWRRRHAHARRGPMPAIQP